MAEHIEFPRCLHGVGGTTLIVTNEADRDARLAEGWSLRPVIDTPDPAPTPAQVENAEPVADAPTKRGRKPTAH